MRSPSSFWSRLFVEAEGFDAWVDGVFAKLLFDAEELVVLGNTLGAVWSTGLDLTSVESNDKVSDGDVFGLAGTVGDDGGPTSVLRHLNGVDGLG